MDVNRRSFGNNEGLNLLDIPSAPTLREWEQHCMRAVAGSWRDVKAAHTWVTEAMGPDAPKENVSDSGG
eukprot:3090729-Pyramimonas_sp.AAC.1